jgi:uncharacterized protein (DUF433 family)
LNIKTQKGKERKKMSNRALGIAAAVVLIVVVWYASSEEKPPEIRTVIKVEKQECPACPPPKVITITAPPVEDNSRHALPPPQAPQSSCAADLPHISSQQCKQLEHLKQMGCTTCSAGQTCQLWRWGKDPCPLLRSFYNTLITDDSDIHRLVPIIYGYAMRVNTVVEMGSRTGHSTTAIMQAYPSNFTIIDLIISSDVRTLERTYKSCAPPHAHLQVIEHDDLTIGIDTVEMLFIDTLHDEGQVRKELELHASKVTKWILFHDVISFGHREESGNQIGRGLHPAIVEFMEKHKEWVEEAYFPFSHGLLVLRRVHDDRCTYCTLRNHPETIPWNPR